MSIYQTLLPSHKLLVVCDPTPPGTSANFHLAVEAYYDARAEEEKAEKFQRTLEGESFTGINENNRHIYIGYVRSMAKGLGVTLPEGIEDINDPVILSRSLSGEGIIGDIWAKVKKIFTSIMNGFTGLMKRIFTRSGRLKARIESIRESLKNRPDLKLAKISPDSIPDGLKRLFPNAANISVGTVNTGISDTKHVLDTFTKVIDGIDLLAYSGVISPSKIKEMQGLIKKKNDAKDDVVEKANINAATPKGGVLKSREKKDAEGDLRNATRELTAVSEQKTKARDSLDKHLDTVNSNYDDAGGVVDDKFETQYANCVKGLNDFLGDIVKKEYIGGKTITIDSGDKEHGIPRLAMEKADAKHDDVTATLSDAKSVSSVLQKALEILTKSSSINDKAAKTMEHFAKAFNLIDSAIASIDANEKTKRKISTGDVDTEGKLKTYKGGAEKYIKPFLKKLQDTFVIFSKITSTFIEISMDTCDAAVDFSLLCMKYYK